MAKNRRTAIRDYHKVIMSELGMNPLHMLKSSFVQKEDGEKGSFGFLACAISN